jgi:hypothetical protein
MLAKIIVTNLKPKMNWSLAARSRPAKAGVCINEFNVALGIARVIIRIARPKLAVSPTLESVTLNPHTIPRLLAGTEPIIELILGRDPQSGPDPENSK